jgi:hypothetical protein
VGCASSPRLGQRPACGRYKPGCRPRDPNCFEKSRNPAAQLLASPTRQPAASHRIHVAPIVAVFRGDKAVCVYSTLSLTTHTTGHRKVVTSSPFTGSIMAIMLAVARLPNSHCGDRKTVIR